MFLIIRYAIDLFMVMIVSQLCIAIKHSKKKL